MKLREMLNERTRRIIGYLIVLVILGFMARSLHSNYQALRGYDWRINYLLMGIAVLTACGTLALYAWQWRLTVLRLGSSITYPQAFRIFFLSNLGRYIPGKVWQFVGWFYLAERAGVGRMQVMTAIALNLVLQTLTGLVLGLGWLILVTGKSASGQYWPFFLLIPVLVVLVEPHILNRVLNLGLRLLGHPPVHCALTFHDMVLFTLVHVGGWVAYGISFYLLVSSITPLPPAELPQLAAAYAVAWIIGFLSFLTPGGLGVRESILAHLLHLWLPTPVAIVVALLSRVWIMAGEMVGVAIAWRVKPLEVEPTASVSTDLTHAEAEQ